MPVRVSKIMTRNDPPDGRPNERISRTNRQSPKDEWITPKSREVHGVVDRRRNGLQRRRPDTKSQRRKHPDLEVQRGRGQNRQPGRSGAGPNQGRSGEPPSGDGRQQQSTASREEGRQNQREEPPAYIASEGYRRISRPPGYVRLDQEDLYMEDGGSSTSGPDRDQRRFDGTRIDHEDSNQRPERREDAWGNRRRYGSRYGDD